MICKQAFSRLLLFILTLSASATYAQVTKVTGVVTDYSSHSPLPFVSVGFQGTSIGVTSDAHGSYSLSTSTAQPTKLQVSFVGYKTAVFNVTPGKEQIINVRLVSQAKQLGVVTVHAQKKTKYRNKDNPAVELIRQVIEHKKQNRPDAYDYVEYEEYDKMMFGFENVSDKVADKKFFRKYKFMFDNRDTTSVPGKNILPVFLDEKLSQNYYRKSPESKKQIILGHKSVNFGNYIDNEGLGQYFKHVYYDIDIYKNNIFLVANEFLSPIADAGPTFYKYFIVDTVEVDNKKVVELEFTPRNTTDMLFEGSIFITLDGNYAVQDASLTINKNINLNFVRSLHADLSFDKNPDGRYHLSKQVIQVDFGITKTDGKGGLFGQRAINYGSYVVNKEHPPGMYKGDAVITQDQADHRDENFWKDHRLDTLTTAESKVYHNIDTLRSMPSYRRFMDIATLLLAGYKNFGWWELGPSNTFYSFNPVEGLKLRVGGRTTPELSKRYYFETYAAYGFKDERWKYFLSATYSLNDKSIYKFPQDYIRASYQRDTKIPGLALQFVEEDNFLLSFKRGENDKYLYNDFYRFDYVKEFENHFSYNIGFRNWTQSPAGTLEFLKQNPDGTTSSIQNLTTTQLFAEFRYAPHEQFYQGKIYRIPIPSKYPVLTLDYTQGLKNIFNGSYSYQNLLFTMDKRFYLSQLGYADVRLQGGKIFGTVPYPLLDIHTANQTYAYDIYSYNLMNFLEFVSDHYAAINIDQHFNGFFFNKIPLFKKLKWRETLSFKGIWGGLSDQNNPALHPDLYQFPVGTDGRPITYSLGSTPYVEGSVGIENIFKFIRVDFVKRFTYLDHPDVASWGIRTRVDFNF